MSRTKKSAPLERGAKGIMQNNYSTSSLNELPRPIYGASPGDWTMAELFLGATVDLLPVVSDPHAQPSPTTDVKAPCKTPTTYDANRLFRGITNWSKKQTTAAEIEAWSRQSDYGICIQTRSIRAIDLDITDPELAFEIEAATVDLFGFRPPRRGRANSPKSLFPFRLEGTYLKRKFKTRAGFVEFLGNGQQFIACGTHPSGARYQWDGGESMPSHIPAIEPERFEAIWSALRARYAVADSSPTATEGSPIDALSREDDLKRADAETLQELRSALLFMAAKNIGDEYDDWQANGQALACFKGHALEADALALFVEYSTACAKFASGEAEAKWRSDLKGERSNYRAIFKRAGEAGWRNPRSSKAESVEAFHAYLPDHKFIHEPTRALWGAPSMKNGVRPWPKSPVSGQEMNPVDYLERYKPIHQIIWHPAMPTIVRDQVMFEGGMLRSAGVVAFNMYRAPEPKPGDAKQARPWLAHLRRVYPDDADHLIRWFAHRVQRPGEKLNHALVLGGAQGIGKDTILEPVKNAVGPWNAQEISPHQAMGRFNGWVKSPFVRMSEARDLGEANRYQLYEALKPIIAAPPDVLRVDEKNLRETYAVNVIGLIITTNNLSDGLYLPADDRRHYVAWSERVREEFAADYWKRMYAWYEAGGYGHVDAYLRAVDLSGFDPKAPPPKTRAFWIMVQSGEAPESNELRDLIDALPDKRAFVIRDLVDLAAMTPDHVDIGYELNDRRNRRTIPHKMQRVGYVPVRNPDATSGDWLIRGRRQTVYAMSSLPFNLQVEAARSLTRP